VGAICTVQTTSDAALTALLQVARADGITATPLVQNSDFYMVVFSSPGVQLETGGALLLGGVSARGVPLRHVLGGMSDGPYASLRDLDLRRRNRAKRP
jgi:hypothetical protein